MSVLTAAGVSSLFAVAAVMAAVSLARAADSTALLYAMVSARSAVSKAGVLLRSMTWRDSCA